MTHHSTLRGARGKIEPETSKLLPPERREILQSQIETADRLIALHDLPAIVSQARAMKELAVAEVLATVAAMVSAAYMDGSDPRTDAEIAADADWLAEHRPELGSRGWFDGLEETPF